MRRRAPVFALFFLAPLVAEYFVGDFPIYLLPVVLLLAPMYGGGALLIREVTRRTGRGWPTIFMLALAFGVLEESILTQSLFNRHYLNLSLLDKGYIPALGTAAPWAVYVLTIHVLWSISAPIGIVEESSRDRRTVPWLRRVGMAVVAGLFVLGCLITFNATQQSEHHFMAKPAQLAWSAAIVIVLVAAAFLLPKPKPRAGGGTVPGPWPVLAFAIVAGLVFEVGIILPTAIGVAVMLLAVAGTAAMTAIWSRRAGWGRWHRFALAAGALATYAWHAFTLGADAHGPAFVVYLVSRIVGLLGAAAVLWVAARKIRATSTPAPSQVSVVA